MTVYVDDAFIPYRRMKMCHLLADTTEELLEMVDLIGVQRKWIQYPGTNREHFDIAASKRLLAIEHGAIPITYRDMGRMSLSRRANLDWKPEDGTEAFNKLWREKTLQSQAESPPKDIVDEPPKGQLPLDL